MQCLDDWAVTVIGWFLPLGVRTSQSESELSDRDH